MATNHPPAAQAARTPTLDELLADDVTLAVMRADHIGAAEVRGLCNAVVSLLDRQPAAPRSRPLPPTPAHGV